MDQALKSCLWQQQGAAIDMPHSSRRSVSSGNGTLAEPL
jgi:hypothetical protein